MSLVDVSAEQSWNQMVKNCRCEESGHHVFYMKHWKATGERCPQIELKWIEGTAFEIDRDGTKFVGYTHCPEFVRKMLSSRLEITWKFDVRMGGDEFDIVALWGGGSKVWLSFNRQPVPDCGITKHDCKDHPDDIYDDDEEDDIFTGGMFE